MREADAVKEVRQATQLVENAILEKDQAVAREGQKNEEVTLPSIFYELFTSVDWYRNKSTIKESKVTQVYGPVEID